MGCSCCLGGSVRRKKFIERKKLRFQLDTENLALVECGDSTAWCLGQPEHPIKVKEFGHTSGRSQLLRIEEESHKMIQTMDNYSA